jgi:NAD(P)-dependent dehydrogenase (short-subunit alcohol dehydrogenase family)
MLIIGAAEGSLGEAIFREAHNNYDFAAINTAGIGDEEIKLDVTHPSQVVEVLANARPDIVVCTVGVNEPVRVRDAYLPLRLTDAFRVNVVGPLEVLRHFVTSPVREGRSAFTKRFVAISSNSARIARTGSMAYCASKAALSMALRVAARELAGTPVQVWGYEPGLLAHTPMTENTAKDYNGPLHRMPGIPPSGLSPQHIAQRVVNDVANFSLAYNGVMFSLDAGEQ